MPAPSTMASVRAMVPPFAPQNGCQRYKASLGAPLQQSCAGHMMGMLGATGGQREGVGLEWSSAPVAELRSNRALAVQSQGGRRPPALPVALNSCYASSGLQRPSHAPPAAHLAVDPGR